MQPVSNPIVSMRDIDKFFPGVHALDKCHFELIAGEVHALVGENGAGKSTLMKCLTGVYQKDGGTIEINGKEVHIKHTRDAQDLGISIIHQEMHLCKHLTVAENVYIGREPRGKAGFTLDKKEINRKTQEILDSLRLNLDPNTLVSQLTVAKQQMIEIAKALSYNAKVLIMDEPTAALTDSEIDDLFVIIKHLRDRGVGIVYISHRMDELKRISDRITVMRDGTYINTVNTAEVEIGQIISMMVGRTIFESKPEIPENPSKEVVLEVKGLNLGRMVRDVSFKLHKGEILGFAGLMGAGRTEVARAIFGADKLESGEIFVRGKKVEINSPSDAVANNIAYLSEDRKAFGVVLGLDVESNIVMSSMKDYTGALGVVNKSKTKKTADHYVDILRVKTPTIRQKVKNLSGGNQQKVIIGKWLARDTDIMIFDEPTRGIDVGAKSEIYKLLNELTQQGKSIIMISSELPEILRMSHRIAVMCEGRLTGELSAEAATQEAIMHLATKRNTTQTA